MNINFQTVSEGDKIPALKKEPITQLQLVKYAGASGDFNPIHTVPEYAKEAGLDGTIAHGMLVMGMLGQMISGWVGVKPVVKYGVSFRAMTKPGDILTATGEVKKKYEKDGSNFIDCTVRIADEQDEVKVEGKVSVKL
ncbi:MAG: dehydratase [Spirochaetales bacterium]|jgi:acyl dehydratase|nr:dehydratase [Spirochaetales bacterium]